MPVQTTYPGVYVQEVPSSVHTITGVSTSTGCFIGRAVMGPLNVPQICNSYTDFNNKFGSATTSSDMPIAVRLFFLNGGTVCWVTRIADTISAAPALAATTVLTNAAGAKVLDITASSFGTIGNTICMNVDYNTQFPEVSFNLTVFNYAPNAAGQLQPSNVTPYSNLSMNPTDPRYALTVINADPAALISVALDGAAPANRPATLISGTPIQLVALQALFTANQNQFMLSLDGSAPVLIDLTGINTATALTITAAMKAAILAAFPTAGAVNCDLTTFALTDGSMLLSIEIPGATEARITPATSAINDIAGPWMLGTGSGGIEISGWADLRPAANGVVFNITNTGVGAQIFNFDNAPQTDITSVTLNGVNIPVTLAGPAAGYMYQNAALFNGLAQNMDDIASAITNPATPIPNFNWKATRWGSRLAIIPMDGTAGRTNKFATLPAAAPGALFNSATRFSSLAGGADGTYPPTSAYTAAFAAIDKDVDIFNLMVIPKDNASNAPAPQTYYGLVSTYCQTRRAILIMDPPLGWSTVQAATNPFTGVNSLRIGLVNDFSAVYYPNVTINNDDGSVTTTGPAGAIAGLMARIDVSRGVWKAPAGTEATLLGINGLQYRLNDSDSGQLNPVGINALRIFPDGIVSWGARTADGDDSFGSQWKYVPVRRTALFIEESLYRGLTWVVFEPNADPLWAAIRLNVGAFMNGLFRQGAFYGTTKDAAYFVKCDNETTTQNDINNGVVNIWVGFAPLKPAEFVILYLQQMTGQIQV